MPDKHPLPRIQTTLENLGGSRWFSVLDQSRAYYQGYIHPASREKTAFVTPWGLYQWVCIPFGLMNAPAVFQRHMEDTLHDFRDKFAMPYLDNVIVYSGDLNLHIEHIRKVLHRMKEKGLKLKLSKCKFFRKEVKYLGRLVNEHGYRMDEESVEAVHVMKDFKPTTIGQVRQMLGLLGYHRRQVQDFAKLAKPLTDLLKTEALTEGNRGNTDNKINNTSKHKIEWTPEQETACDKRIHFVTSPPILAYPDYNEEFFVHTDASNQGLGCILYQRQKGDLRVIAYRSRTLLPAENNYHSTKLEFLALKWAVCEKFREYLGYANHFYVYTDNNPLLYIMDSSKLNANGQRWVSELSESNFTIRYRPGVINRDADCLSRLPLNIDYYVQLCSKEVDPDSFQAIFAGMQVQKQNGETWVAHVNTIAVDNKEEVMDNVTNLQADDIRNEQQQDEVISRVKNLLNATIKTNLSSESKSVKLLL